MNNPKNRASAKRSLRKSLLRLSSSLAVIGLVSQVGANAQDTEPAPQEQQGGIQTIVVTAQKRAENVQDIPLSVTAIGTEALQTTGFEELADLSRLSPSLQLSNFGPIAFVTLRGIGNENTTAGGDPGVALHYDGVYLGRPVATLFSAFDTERVEVLRGPQGTLYGRNATGGSINYITKKPTEDFEAAADFTYGNYDRKRARASLNVPISEAISTRVVGFWENRDGYTQNAFPGGRNGNDADNWGIRGHLSFEPLDSDFKAIISANYVETGGVGSTPELREFFPGSTTGQNLAGPPIPGTNNYLVNGVPILNDLRPFRESKDANQFRNSDFLLLSATLEYDFGGITVKSISGYAETSYAALTDQDYSPLPLATLLLQESSEQFSQELQILSNNGIGFNWILGGYYFHEDATRQSQFFGSRYDIIAGGTSQRLGITVPSGFDVGGDVTSESYAFFAQATYDMTDQLAITGGIRYTNDSKDGTNRGFQFGPAPYSGPVNANFDKITYRVAVDYDISDDVLLYGSFSTGYKSGGINQVAIPALTNPVFRPETVEAIEFGVKSQFLDRTLQFNMSLYQNKYDDLQFQVFGLFGPEAFNASGATVQGVEIEFVALPAEWFQFDGSMGYTDATFDAQIVNGIQLDGNRVQRTPEWTFNAGTTINWNVGNSSMKLRAEVNHTSEIFYTAFNRSAGFTAPGGSDLAEGYINANLRLFWTSADERYSLQGYVTNLFNSTQIGNVFRDIGFLDTGGGGGPENITYRPPRQYGITAGFKF